jgi:hypothetical protein
VTKNRFYNKRAWRRASRLAVLKTGHRCEQCGAPIWRNYNAHHRYAVRSHPDLALLPANHMALCLKCHGLIEAAERDKRIKGATIEGFPTGPDHPWNKPTGARL